MSSLLAALYAVGGALGLSAAAGLNAYIPLLIVAVMQNREWIGLAQPYDSLGAWWVIALLALLLTIEIVIDKIPRVDRINDLFQTIIRPGCGALLFAAEMSHVAAGHAVVWAVLGLVIAGGVHAAKMMSRPIINYGSAGVGAAVVSLVEDLVAVTLTMVALLVPVLAPVLMVLFGWILVKLFRWFYGGWRKERRVYRVVAVPVRSKAVKVTVVAAEEEAPSIAREHNGGGV